MKNFLNTQLFAPNVLTIKVDQAIVDEFQPLCGTAKSDPEYHVVKPDWDSDLIWISANSERTFHIFEDAFRRLGIGAHVAPYVDLEREPRLYAGFILTRQLCRKPNFHVDWSETNNEAFTLITPISRNVEGHGILYCKSNGEIAEHDYRNGEAVIFGDHFEHSTKPSHAPEPLHLLCFQFGTDKMEYWDNIHATAGSQSDLIQQPDGKFARKGRKAAY